MAWGEGILSAENPSKTNLCRLSRAGVAEAARFGQLSVLAQRRVLPRWNWMMIPSMTTLRTRHLPRLQVRHQ